MYTITVVHQNGKAASIFARVYTKTPLAFTAVYTESLTVARHAHYVAICASSRYRVHVFHWIADRVEVKRANECQRGLEKFVWTDDEVELLHYDSTTWFCLIYVLLYSPNDTC